MPENIQPANQGSTDAQREAAERFAPSISSGMPWRLMISTLFLLLFSFFIYAGLKFGYNSYVDSQLQVVDRGTEELAARVTESEQEELLIFYSQLVNLERVLGERRFSRNIFGFLEDNTLPLAYYREARYNRGDRAMSLAGFAATIETFAQQAAVLENAPEVERVSVDDVRLVGTTVDFTVTIEFKEEFFKEIQ